MDELSFDSSSMVNFRKRLAPEILGEINEMIIAKAEKKPPTDPPNSDDNSKDEPPNEGDLLLDATCAPQNIRYPLDLSLLNEARENLEGLIDELHEPADGEKPRTYRRKARKEYLNVARKKKKTSKEIRKAIKKQLNYIKWDWASSSTASRRGKPCQTSMCSVWKPLSTSAGRQNLSHRRKPEILLRFLMLESPIFNGYSN